MKPTSAATCTSAVALVFLAGVHLNWARGSSWPAETRAELAEAVIGADRLPGATPTVIVAVLLVLAAAAVAGFPARESRLRRIVATMVTGAFALRAIVGFSGIMPQTSPTFLRWDRQLYSPLCLALAILSSPATRH